MQKVLLFVLLSITIVQNCFSQERKNFKSSEIDSTIEREGYDEPIIISQKKLEEFTLWDYLDGKEEWKGKKGYVSYLKESNGGLVLSKIKFQDKNLYSISYEEHNGNDIETTSLLLSDKSANALFKPDKFNWVCVLNESTEEHFYYSRKSIYSRLSRTIENQIDDLSEYDYCESYLPLYISDEGALRFTIVVLPKEKDEEYYMKRFEMGPYIEVDSINYHSTFNNRFTETIFDDEFVVRDVDSYSERNIKDTQTSLYFSGSGIKNTDVFTAESPWRITWTNDGQFMSGYLIDENDETVEVIINSDDNRGRNNIYKTGTFHIKVNSIGNWVIKIHN
ncbi:hypothetical protein ACKGJO_05200 [Gracilimonas sp. Q87]|uniref:hypothetical protein n=1 Tax=Gracilimonas sp. Q87 TaxID=3384766 RepID=UPI0039841110